MGFTKGELYVGTVLVWRGMEGTHKEILKKKRPAKIFFFITWKIFFLSLEKKILWAEKKLPVEKIEKETRLIKRKNSQCFFYKKLLIQRMKRTIFRGKKIIGRTPKKSQRKRRTVVNLIFPRRFTQKKYLWFYFVRFILKRS